MKKLKKRLRLPILLLCLSVCLAFGYYFAVTSDTALSPQKLELSNQRICVYDNDNAPLKNISAATKTQTSPIGEIPLHTQYAFVSAEDKRFFSHHGFDFPRIVKAATTNAASHALKQGASTISQQLIKNTHLTQEKTLTRKLREWKLTLALEQRYSKQEILEKYLNVIYFGHNCFGIRAASEFYFDKTPQELDLADSAILAGLVKSPNNYSPFKNPENCRKRKRSVLNGMLKNGFITREEYDIANEKALPTKQNNVIQNAAYLHAVFEELGEIADSCGLSLNGDLAVYTYLDTSLQTEAESILENHTSTDKNVIIASSDTGGVKAYVSSIGSAKRSPGSLLKPLLVYAPCLEENLISPVTPVLDEKINFGGYSPNNYDDVFHGYVSAREALAKSFNVPAVKLLNSLGISKGETYLRKLHLPLEAEDGTLALALGGMKNGFTLRQLIGGYGALANGGVYTGTAFISKILLNGNCVYERTPANERVFSEATSFLTTDMLTTAAKSGTAKKLRNLPFTIAAKTGTAGTARGNTDAYALTYTTQDVIGVWLGNADNSPTTITGGGLPCNYALRLNEYVYQTYRANGKSIAAFAPPQGVVEVDIDKENYVRTHSLYLADENAPKEYRLREWFKMESIPLLSDDSFSHPVVAMPEISVSDGKVHIVFHEQSPDFYEYKIERTEGETTSVLYEGGYIQEFIDENVTTEVTYRYYVTPSYKDKKGTAIELPSVYITPPQAGIPKEWWRT